MYRDDGKSPAKVVRAEVRKNESGEYGGAYYVAINGLALGVGYDFHAKELADEIARRWNHVANVCEHKWGDGIRHPEGGASVVCQKCGLVGRADKNF